MSRVCVVHQQDGTDVRVGKVCRTLSVRHMVTYLGWDRDGVTASPDLGSASRRLFVMRSGYGPRSVLVRLLFLFWVMRELSRIRPDAVVVVNEELAFPLAFLMWPLRFKLIVDIHDPIADRVASPILGRALAVIQRVARDRADRLWVTDDDRLKRLAAVHRPKATVIPNYPNRPRFDISALAREQVGAEVVIGVLGSLHANRGLGLLRRAMDECGACRAEIAGWIADAEAENFCKSEGSRYHGVVGMQESLRIMASCDVIFCFYNPRIPNNVNASPNKVYEAVCVGKKCIVNSETRISKWVEEHAFGYTCPYDDVATLARILRDIQVRLAEHRLPSEKLITYAESRLYWEVAEPRLLASI